MSKKPLEIDMIAGSQLRDTQGEMLSIDGADISELEAGRGRLNDNHGKGFFNAIGRVTGAKKIYSLDDCTDPRHEYYWNKVKAPYIYVKGHLYDDEDHPNARAAAAIMRNVHKSDCPLKIKASVEGGVTARGVKDPSLLARTKIHSVAVTFTPANNATLIEPIGLSKNAGNHEEDMILIKSVMHLAKTDVPSFRSVTRNAQAEKVYQNFEKMQELARELGLKTELVLPESPEELVKHSLIYKIETNIFKINELAKQLAQKKNEKLEKASKKQIAQMTGNKEVANWVSTHLNRDDLALWFSRSYKKDPSIFNDENRTKLEHYGSVKDKHKELQDLRLGKEHDFDKGMSELRSANSAAEERYKDSSNLISPDEGTKKIVDTGDGYAWYSLGKGSCPKEAEAMGHCGNEPSEEEGDNILSLRKEKKVGDQVYHEPHLTFINNNGHLGEMKGKGNTRPTEKYHKHIVPLLESDHVNSLIGGGFAAESNFSMSDLKDEDRKRVLEKKPDIDPLSTMKTQNASDFPEKHDYDIRRHNNTVATMNKAFKEHGDLDSIMDNANEHTRDAVLSHPAFREHITPKHVNSHIEKTDSSISKGAISIVNNFSQHLGADSISKMMTNVSNDEAWLDRNKDNDDASADYHNDMENVGLNDEVAVNEYHKKLFNAPNVSKQHLDNAFKDQYLRAKVLSSGKSEPEHMKQALNDKDYKVRQAAINSKHFSPEHMEQALGDSHKDVRGAAAESKHFDPAKHGHLLKALTAGYGGAGAPTNSAGGSVLQSESLDDGRGGKAVSGFKYMTCKNCGNEQVYMKHQVKCRECGKHASLEDLYKLMIRDE